MHNIHSNTYCSVQQDFTFVCCSPCSTVHGDKRDTSNSAVQHKGAKMANTVATPPSVGDPASLGCTTKRKWSRWAWSKSGWMTLKRGLSSRQGGWAITSSHHSGGVKINIHRRYDQLQYKRLWPVSWLTLVVKSLCHWCRHVGAPQGHDKVAQLTFQSSCFHPIEEERDGGS